MADTKVSGLTENTAPAHTDIAYLVDDPSGTPLSQKIQLANLVGTGWLGYGGTWTYASATTFTVSGDQTVIFGAGTKIKLTQTSAKYFYVVSSSYSANTTVTIMGGSDYSLANAAITSPYFSYAATPQGFPDWLNYSVTWGGGSPAIGNGTLEGKFTLKGKTCRGMVRMVMGSTTTYGSGTWTWTVPIAARIAALLQGHSVWGQDTGTAYKEGTTWSTLTTTISVINTNTVPWASTTPHTWASTDELVIHFEYEIA